MGRSTTTAEPDYAAEDTLVVDDPERLRALAGEVRIRIVTLLRDRARSTSELADALELPRGTVAHHVKVLERAGLIRVVRTRRVRAVTEKYYGRVARLFLLRSDDGIPGESAVGVAMRHAAHEVERSPDVVGFGMLHLTLAEADAKRFSDRLKKLVDDLRARQVEDGVPFGFAAALYRRKPS